MTPKVKLIPLLYNGVHKVAAHVSSRYCSRYCSFYFFWLQ